MAARYLDFQRSDAEQPAFSHRSIVFIGRASQKMGLRLQTVYQQGRRVTSSNRVHDLKKPLTGIATHIKNLLITPEQTGEVVVELNQDLMRLQHKLSGFLKPAYGRFREQSLYDKPSVPAPGDSLLIPLGPYVRPTEYRKRR